MWLWFRIWTKIWRIYGFGEKKARISGFAYPYSPPLYTHFLEENINLISYCPSAPYEHTVHPVQFRRKKSFLPDNNCSEIIHLGREGFLNVSLRKSADLQPRRSNQQPLKVSFSHLGWFLSFKSRFLLNRYHFWTNSSSIFTILWKLHKALTRSSWYVQVVSNVMHVFRQMWVFQST